MTRRRKCLQRSSFSSQTNRRKQRTRFRQRFRLKTFNSSNSTITQIATSAFNLLHISPDSNLKTFQFIQRNELTRQQALTMSDDQRPIISIRQSENPSSYA